MSAIARQTARSKGVPPAGARGSAKPVRLPAKYAASCSAARLRCGLVESGPAGPSNRTNRMPCSSAATPSGPIGEGTDAQSIPPSSARGHGACTGVLLSISGPSGAPRPPPPAPEAPPEMSGIVVTFLALGGFALLMLVLSMLGGHLHLGHLHLGHMHLHLGHGHIQVGHGGGTDLSLPVIAGFLGALGFGGA